jgi:hypothetical protein
MIFDHAASFCHPVISIAEENYGKNQRDSETYRQKALGQAQEVHDLHRSHLQKAE